MSPKYARATAVAVQNGKCLLVQERRARRFSLPGGRIRPGEASHDTVTRELYEETGLRAKNPTFVGYHEGHYATHHIYLLEVKGEVRLNRRELSNFLWWNGSDALLIQRHVGEVIQLCRDLQLQRSGGPQLFNEPDLQSRMAAGENERLEFKSIPHLTEGQSKKTFKRKVGMLFVESLAGFLNARGGTLLIGVDDDGVAAGIDYGVFDERKPNHDGFALYLRNLLTDRFGGAASSHLAIRFHEVDGKDICEVGVEPSELPIYIDDNGKAEFFLRVGNSTRKLPVDEAVKYVQNHFKGT